MKTSGCGTMTNYVVTARYRYGLDGMLGAGTQPTADSAWATAGGR